MSGMEMLQEDVDEVREFFNNLMYNRWEMREEMAEEFYEFGEDLECFWADRASEGGDGWCWKREREQLESDCWW